MATSHTSIPRRAACPVCQMPVDTRQALHTLVEGGRVYFFCSPGCREHFQASGACCGRQKGPWGRWLDRLAQANAQQFGTRGPRCH